MGTTAVKLAFSHVGIHVTDVDKMVDFYTRVLGLIETDRGEVRGLPIVFTSQDASEHHQVVLVGGRPSELAFNPINQLSFRVASLEDLQAVYRNAGAEPEVTKIRGTHHGYSLSVYFMDPEGNRIEVFWESEWYVRQPVAEPLDLNRPADEIRAEIEVFCRDRPGFQPLRDWQTALAERIQSRFGAEGG